MTYRFCPQCATPLEPRVVYGRERLACPACAFIHFREPKVAAGVLVEEDGRVLLARRGIEPELGKWYLPSGFVEYDETPEEAARREVEEETGLIIAVDGLVGAYPIRDRLGRRGVWLCYRGRLLGGEMCAADDVTEVGWFAPDDIPANLAFESTRQALDGWLAACAR